MNCRCLDSSTVRLGVSAATREEAVRAAIEILRNDPRIVSWNDFQAALDSGQVLELGADCGGAVCLVHGRSAGVSGLALSALRLAAPVTGEKGDLLSLFFVFAIPTTRAAEYLRAVGALARACADAKCRETLMSAATEEEFARRLSGWIS